MQFLKFLCYNKKCTVFYGCFPGVSGGEAVGSQYQARFGELLEKDAAEKIVAVEKYCTKPELEMLLILAEHLEREFEKVKTGKSRVSPKDFCKAHVQYNRKRYNNSTQFYYDYFGSDISKLVSAIRSYRGLQGAHKKDEGYLADLLK